ncbi:MAG: NAD-dependent DNA ligase LigA [Leptonema sp. (in: Bacteria)]|nr:NAD-dependent DNA ligase LigA [Leptonema sp. (in: bacteria)]
MADVKSSKKTTVANEKKAKSQNSSLKKTRAKKPEVVSLPEPLTDATDDVSRYMNQLSDYLLYHQYLYYVEKKPILSDRSFDRLLGELSRLEKENPNIKIENSATQNVGSDLETDFPKFQHTINVLSLTNTYSTEEAIGWAKKVAQDSTTKFQVQWKVDGATLVLYYEAGTLKHGVTRGTGNVGDEITRNALTIQSVPAKLSQPIDLTARGEAYMCYSDFERFNEEAGSIYANPRNLTAGSLKQKKSKMVAERPIRWVAFDVHLNTDLPTDSQVLNFAKSIEIPVFEDNRSVPLSKLESTIEEFRSKVDSLDIPIDGLVLKIDDLQLREKLGVTAASPRWAVALKFEPEIAESIIEDIEVFVGRTGRVTPRAKLEPVQLAGTTVTYATLHNADYIERLGVQVGATVLVSKRGEIIPAVEEVVNKGDGPAYKFPERCPSCNSILKIDADVVDRYCVNPDCQEKKIQLLIFFCGRKQMDIAGLGEKTIRTLYKEKLIQTIEDIFTFEKHKQRAQEIEGFGEKSIQVIINGVKSALQKDLRRSLPSLGLREIGPAVTDILINEGFTSIQALFDFVDQPNSLTELQQIHGIGPETAAEIHRQLTDNNIRIQIKQLIDLGVNFSVIKPKKDVNIDQVFAGQTWCVTGSFDHFKPRDKAMTEIELRGGKISSSVSSKTTHLLAGEKAGSKLDKANQLGTTIVNEAEFLKLIGVKS